MSELLKDRIQREAKKLVVRHQRYAWAISESTERRKRRGESGVIKTVKRPSYWDVDRGFDPYYVLRRSDSLAYAIDKALKTGRYRPHPAVSYSVPKNGGGVREVSVFQVADQAVANLLFFRLLQKNKGRFTSRSFAYRTDVGVHDAILHVASGINGRRRIYVAEYDFQKYFDSISHEHLNKILLDRRFYVTDHEKRIIDSFLRSSTYPVNAYSRNPGFPRTVGIPQGVSISLFLANLAAYPLDRRLQQLRVDFARYADDTLIWSDDYNELCRAVDALEQAGKEIGVEINPRKSPGVRLLVPKTNRSELPCTNYIDYLGHRISANSIGIHDNAVRRIKNHISYLVYSNLLKLPVNGVFNLSRMTSGWDMDYVVMIAQVRRYLYGDLSESRLARYASGDTPERRYQGLMSFFPLVDDSARLAELDGWLQHTIYTSIRLREKLFQQHTGVQLVAEPYSRLPSWLVAPQRGALRIPSFSRISSVLRKAATQFGATNIANPQSPSS